MNKCLWCDTDISNKRVGAKFCSPSHKLNWNRKPDEKQDDTLNDTDTVIDTVNDDTVDTDNDTVNRAVLLPVDITQTFSKQWAQALALDKRAVHNTRAGKDEWVVPGECKWGPCLNPNCEFHSAIIET